MNRRQPAPPIGFRIPPAAIEVERHVLGAAFVDQDAAAKMVARLREGDFYLEKHQLIFRAIASILPSEIGIDLLTISAALDRLGILAAAGGDAYLMEISAEVVSSANVSDHMQILREKEVLRGLIRRSTILLEEAYAGHHEAVELLDRAEADVAALRATGATATGLRHVTKAEALRNAVDAYDAPLYRGESTGWKSIDKHLRVAPGQVNVVTGIPNHGKSEWLDALMINLSLNCDWRVGYFSPENSPLHRHHQKLAEKCIGRRLYGEQRMSREEYAAILDKFVLDRFQFLDEGLEGATLDQVLSEFARMRPKIQAAVIDPWNRLEHAGRREASETDYVRDSLRRVARFAKATQISTWIVAHPSKLYRDPKNGTVTKPGMYDISGSAHWANICDNGVMVWRDFKEARSEIHILKVRHKDNGYPGMVLQKYDVESGRYRELTDAEQFNATTDAAPPKPKKGKGTPSADWGKQTSMTAADGEPLAF